MPSLIESVEKIGDLAVRFTLPRQLTPFLADMAMGFASIVSAGYADAMSACGRATFDVQGVRDGIAAGRLAQLLQEWRPPQSKVCLLLPGAVAPSAGLAAFLAMACAGDARPAAR